MGSTASTRLWRVCKAAGRPWPQISEDPVIDYMIMEAVALRVQMEDSDALEEQKRKDWMKDRSHLKEVV